MMKGPEFTGAYAMATEGRFDTKRAINLLNQILEAELAGVVRYTHYSLMVFGHGRIPIVDWLRTQASESLLHAQEAGEMITHLGTPVTGHRPPAGDAPSRHRCDPARVPGAREGGAETLPGTPGDCHGVLGGARGVRAQDAVPRGTARGGGGQDAPLPRRTYPASA